MQDTEFGCETKQSLKLEGTEFSSEFRQDNPPKSVCMSWVGLKNGALVASSTGF